MSDFDKIKSELSSKYLNNPSIWAVGAQKEQVICVYYGPKGKDLPLQTIEEILESAKPYKVKFINEDQPMISL